MDCTGLGWAAPRLDERPDVDDVRPVRCRRCRCPARHGARIVVHGHGVRFRLVVVWPTADGERPKLGECWQRRYRCTACLAVMVVLPRGVMPRYLYSAGAIVVAWLLTAEPPVGEGSSDAEAYERQGMYRQTRWTDAQPYRWRSLDRWAALAGAWWPSLADGGLHALLVGLWERSRTGERQEVITAALDAHVWWGSAM